MVGYAQNPTDRNPLFKMPLSSGTLTTYLFKNNTPSSDNKHYYSWRPLLDKMVRNLKIEALCYCKLQQMDGH